MKMQMVCHFYCSEFRGHHTTEKMRCGGGSQQEVKMSEKKNVGGCGTLRDL